MSIWQSIVIGIIEGVTEFLPISSTGHLILAGFVLGIPDTEFTKSFGIVIQLGAITSVVFLYWSKLWNFELIKKVAAAFIPTGIVGLLFYTYIKNHLLGSEDVVLVSLFIGGLLLIMFERIYKEPEILPSREHLTFTHAVIIGLFQSIAIIPGVSRAAATILGGLALGIKRTTIVEFSFLLAIPTMLAASALDVYKSYEVFTIDQIEILGIGFVTSFIVALLSVKFLLRYIERHDFIAFGVYRIVIAFVFWIFVSF